MATSTQTGLARRVPRRGHSPSTAEEAAHLYAFRLHLAAKIKLTWCGLVSVKNALLKVKSIQNAGENLQCLTHMHKSSTRNKEKKSSSRDLSLL